MIKIEFEERSDIVYKILDMLKNNQLDNIQKKIIYDIVCGFEKRTEKQKEKFFRFYNLLDNQDKNYRLSDMARYYKCTSNNVRLSIGSVRNSLINMEDDQLLILKNMIQKK